MPNLESILLERLKQRSGYDERRSYIGMSKASECPLVLYRQYRDGAPATIDSHIGAWLGYTMERAVRDLLDGEIGPSRELTAFDGLVRGHTDGEWGGGLLEIKSVTQDKIREILSRQDIPRKHWLQVQAYLHYGDWEDARIVYVPRDFGQPIVWHLRYSKNAGSLVDTFFASVVDAVRSRREPTCRCGRCSVPERGRP